jgi:serine/alanine adding enzyme
MPYADRKPDSAQRKWPTRANVDRVPEYRVTTEVESSQWYEFVRNHPGGSIFQTPQMQAVYELTHGYTPHTLFAVDARSNRLSGVMAAVVIRVLSGPLGTLSARAIVQHGPLIVPGRERDVTPLLLQRHNADMEKRALYTEVWNRCESETDLYGQCGYAPARHLEIVADLRPSESQLWEGLTSRRRRSVLRALRHGVEIHAVGLNESLVPLYRMLQTTYRRRRLPLADITLFDAAQRLLEDSGQVRFAIATLSHRVVACKVLLIHGPTAYAWYAGSSHEGQAVYANDLLGWEAMLWSKSRGCDRFDFGGAGAPDVDYGPRAFKLQFGGQLADSARMTKTHLPALRRLATKGFGLYRCLRYSLPIGEAASLVRHHGDRVGQPNSDTENTVDPRERTRRAAAVSGART